MKSFITQCAEHYAASPEKLRSSCFIFPSRRSLLHFRMELKRISDARPEGTPPLKFPRTYTVNDFFQNVYGVETTDRIRLILALYECYKALNDHPEPLDEFIHWGGVMLSDFDNLDKYLVDAGKIFVNVGDFRAIQDTYQYLTDTQRSAIEHFLAHFRDRNGRLTVQIASESDDVKTRFLKVWNLLGPLYKAFNEKLSAEGMAYEGKVYRALANSIQEGMDVAASLASHFPGTQRYVFVGLNALSECEKTVFRAMRNAGIAEFVWDFSSREIKDGRNKASFFLKKNLEEFPQAFPLDTDAPLRRPAVRVVSVPSSVGQTKLAPQILSEVSGSLPEETAFVLPDENLLLPLLSAIPGDCESVNITMGYPLDKSAVYTFMKAYGALQLSFRVKDGEIYFHHRAVEDMFSSSIFRVIANDEELEAVSKVKKEAKQFVPIHDLHNGPVTNTLFTPIVPDAEPGTVQDLRSATLLDTRLASASQNEGIARSFQNILSLVGMSMYAKADQDGDLPVHLDMEVEFIIRFRKVLTSICAIPLEVMPGTWMRLLDGMLKGESVPFEGDALKGLQVMGTLETRALDFKNVVILSCNEDLFPHRSVDNSFIPPELRKGFGMPTVEYQDSVWAYYFYRLLQRAENVWLVYDSRTEGLLSGEESRYIKQLEYHFGFPLKRYTAISPIAPPQDNSAIEKTQEDIDRLRNEGHLSASSLQSYLACQAKFYYQSVKGLKEEDEVTESLDASMIGIVFHGCMEQLYKDKSLVSVEDIRSMLADEPMLRTLVRNGICEQMKSLDVEGRNIVIEDVILQYLKGALRHDLKLLGDSGSEGFRILGLERYLRMEMDGFKFIGFADRIDSYKRGEVRIVDYKTGHVEDEDILITDGNAATVTEKLFGESNTGRPKIALQLWLYDQFAHRGIVRPGEIVVNSIYSTAKLLTTPLPDVPESPAFSGLVRERLHGMLEEIADTTIPWTRTTDKHVCSLCEFRCICGR